MRDMYTRLCLYLSLLLLAGCGDDSGRDDNVPDSDRTTPPPPDPIATIGEWIEWGATWISIAAGLAIAILPLAGFLLSLFGYGALWSVLRKHAMALGVGLVGTCFSAAMVAWMGAHFAWFFYAFAGLFVAGLFTVAWFRREEIVDVAEAVTNSDLDNDNDIAGEPCDEGSGNDDPE